MQPFFLVSPNVTLEYSENRCCVFMKMFDATLVSASGQWRRVCHGVPCDPMWCHAVVFSVDLVTCRLGGEEVFGFLSLLFG